MTTAARPYAGVPGDLRRAERRTTLLQTALQIAGTDGAAALTVSGLCRAAGLNDRYFYENFTDCDAVLVALTDELATELTRRIREAVAAADPGDLRACIRAAILAATTYVTDDPRRARLAFVESASHPALRKHRQDLTDLFVALIVEQGARHFGAEAARRAGNRARFTAIHLFGGLIETGTSWRRGDFAMIKAKYVDQVADLFVATMQLVYVDDTKAFR